MVSEKLVAELGELLKSKYNWDLDKKALAKLANAIVDYCLWSKEVENSS